MTNRIFILCLILYSLSFFSQNINENFLQYIQNADKIILASHEDLNLVFEEPGKRKVINRSPLKNNKPNNAIIKKRVVLDLSSRQELLNIIDRPKTDSIWDGAYCFEPHHVIFIYKAKKWSYVDLCFGCDKYNYSKDLNINKANFLSTYHDWRKLEALFRKHNLN